MHGNVPGQTGHFDVTHASLNQHLKAGERKEPYNVYMSSGTLHRLEQNVHIIKMIGSFHDSSGVKSSHLFREVRDDESASEL